MLSRPPPVVRRAVGIAKGHRRAGYSLPPRSRACALVLAGIRRTKGMAPTQKSALLTDDVLAMVATCNPDTLAGVRDRCPSYAADRWPNRIFRGPRYEDGRCFGEA